MSDTILPPPGIVENVRLPDLAALPGEGRQQRYDRRGRRQEGGSVIVVRDGVLFVWTPFVERTRAGQRATMTFANLFGPWQIGATAGEWDQALDRPRIGSGLIGILATPRGVSDALVVCRNLSSEDLHCAIGLILILP